MPIRFETFGEYAKLDEDWHEYQKTATVWAKQLDYDFEVDTLEGVMKAHAGDYLCQGPAGERWPVRKDIFEHTYKKVGDCGGDKEKVGQ